MNNPFDALPSYIKDSPQYSRFLELVNGYLLAGALEVSLYKNAFLGDNKPDFIISALAQQLGVSVDLPFVDGAPDWKAYYTQLLFAVRAKSFVTSFQGCLADFITGDPLKDGCSLSVIDFSVAKENKQAMSVTYSALALNEDLTSAIVSKYLIPDITGVREELYYSQFGQILFGFDIDEKEGVRIKGGTPPNDDYYHTEEITTNLYSVGNATIAELGSGVSVGDEIVAKYEVSSGDATEEYSIAFKVTTLALGAFLEIVNTSATYPIDPSKEGVVVQGSSGMKVNIVGSTRKGYFIRGWDNGYFISLSSRRGT